MTEAAGQTTRTTIRATFHDGKTTRHHEVEVERGSFALSIRAETFAEDVTWPVDGVRLTYRDRQAPPYSLRSLEPGREDERLIIQDRGDLKWLEEACSGLRKRGTVERKELRKYVWLSAGAVLSLILLIFVVIPMSAGTLAALIPSGVEQRLGQGVLAALEHPRVSKGRCTGAEGLDALNRLKVQVAGSLEGEALALAQASELVVLDWDLVNALALPGGYVVLTSGLLNTVDTAEGIVGILAHELGHVVERHPLQAYIERSAIAVLTGMVFGDLTGGAILGGILDQGLGGLYSREMEREADAYAATMLLAQGISLTGLKDFMAGLAKREGRLGEAMAWMSTHPASAEREAFFAEQEAKRTLDNPLPIGTIAILRRACHTSEAKGSDANKNAQ